MRARQMVHERLIMAHALPNVSKPPNMLQPLSTSSRAMIVGLSSKDVSLMDLSVLARWALMPKLLGVRGVANVAVWGLRSRQLQVQVDPERLRDKGVTLDQVIESTGDALWVSPLSFLEASTPGAGGWIDGPNQRLGIQHVQPIKTSPGELAKVPVNGASWRLGDVAKVVEEHQPLIGDALINNEPGLLVVIEKLPHAGPAEVVRGVEAALDELRPGLPGINIDSSVFRTTSFIDNSIDNLRMALLVGAVLLVLVLWALHFEWRATLVSIVAIALSLVTAWVVLDLSKTTLDTMVLAGLVLALAAVIDDAVADVTNIVRRLRRGGGQDSHVSTAASILEACLEIRSPIVYATLIAVLAVAPLFLIGGPFGAFVDPLAVSYLLALLASLAVAMMVTPALAWVLLRRASLEPREPPLGRWLEPRYEAVLSRTVRAPRLMLLVAGAFVLAGAAVVPLLSWSLPPSFKERDVRISWKAALGTSHPEMRRIMTQAGQELRQLPGIRRVATHIGRAVTGDQVVGLESAQIWVSIDPDVAYDATLAAIRATVEGYPGFDAEVQTYLTDKVREALTGADRSIVVRVEGPEREALRREADKVAQILSGIAGIANARVEGRSEAPHVQVEVDLAAAGQVGLKPGDVRRAVATVFAGLEVGHLFEEQKVFEVVVWGAPEARRSLTDLSELLIHSERGYVRLADVAKVQVAPTPAVIEREGITRRVDIRADVAGRAIGSVAADVKERLQRVEFPREYHAVLLRDYAERQAARWRIVVAALAAAAGIYLLLQACFQSWRLAAVFCLTLLAAPLGGILAMVAAGGGVFLGSLAGFFAVLGLAARNGILVVHRFQQLERHHGEALGPGLVVRGMRDRFWPVVTSATAIIAALLPVVALGDIAGLEIVHPMAVVIVGGVVTSAIVNLFVVPTVYLSAAARQPQVQAYGREQHA
jgi:Cu/Ag efflux pump CusA